MKVIDAAYLVDASYDGKFPSTPVDEVNDDGVQAYLLKDGTLVLRGTDERYVDWDKNADVAAYRIDGNNFGGVPSIVGTKWHRGFFRYAERVDKMVKGQRVKRVMGHSLAGAAAQLLALAYGVPAIVFGCPTPLFGKQLLKGEHRILNIRLSYDKVPKLVPKLVPFQNARQTGHRYELTLPYMTFPNHKMDYYIKAVRQKSVTKTMPLRWP